MTNNSIDIEKLLADLREGRYIVPSFEHEAFTQEQINDFVDRIFGIPWAFISERSMISDFCEGAWSSEDGPRPDCWVTVPEAYARINAAYGTSLSYETHPLLVDVLNEIYCQKA